jgi:hypothetical protein
MNASSRLAILGILLVAGCAAREEMMTGVPLAGTGGAGPIAGNVGDAVQQKPIMGMMPAPGGGGSSAAGGGAGSVAVNPGTAGASGVAGAAGMTAAGAGGDAAGAGGGEAGAAAPMAGQLPRVPSTDGVGPWNGVEKVMNTPPGGWLIYPKEIGKDGTKHPIFIFGPGGGTTPMTYETSGMHWDRYGSYGFVIYVLPRSTGDGAAMKAGLDWVIEQNGVMTSPLYQKLDITKICAAGHSQGSVTTFDFMPDDRVTTTIHISGGSFDGQGPSKLKNDTLFICGPSSSADVAYPQCEGDFMNSKVPTVYTKVMGSDHLTSGRLAWAESIAWMLWHLAGHDEWKKEFLEPGGKFQTGIFMTQTKNW